MIVNGDSPKDLDGVACRPPIGLEGGAPLISAVMGAAH
jgi:hypothetical protein